MWFANGGCVNWSVACKWGGVEKGVVEVVGEICRERSLEGTGYIYGGITGIGLPICEGLIYLDK